MSVNFMQILKAYSAFNNGGVAVTPKIADFISDRFGKRVEIKFDVPPIIAVLQRWLKLYTQFL